MRNRREENSTGFALVEAMMALSIVALCLALLVGFISLGQRLQARSDRQARETRDLAALDDVLEEIFGQITPVLVTDRGAEAVPFEGGARGLNFAAIAPKPFAAAEPLLFQLRFEPEGGLILAWTRGRGEERAVLMEGAEGGFSYQVDGAWRSSSSAAPSLVKLTLSGDGAPFELVWLVRVLRPQSCAVNPRRAWCDDRRG